VAHCHLWIASFPVPKSTLISPLLSRGSRDFPSAARSVSWAGQARLPQAMLTRFPTDCGAKRCLPTKAGADGGGKRWKLVSNSWRGTNLAGTGGSLWISRQILAAFLGLIRGCRAPGAARAAACPAGREPGSGRRRKPPRSLPAPCGTWGHRGRPPAAFSSGRSEHLPCFCGRGASE